MLPATDDKIKRWEKKYGKELLNYFNEVRSGKLTVQELADKMNITKEGARKYFHQYYSEADLIGTRFFALPTTKKQPKKAIGNTDSENLTTLCQLQSDTQTIKSELLELAKDFREHDKEVFVYLDMFKKQLATLIENIELRAVGRSNFRFEKDDD